MDEPETPLKWYLRPWVVIVFLFVVLGPFGLPFLYKSPKFNKPWKVGLTILTLAYTGYVVGMTIEVVRRLTRSFDQLRAILG